jgi:hypothetical protein
MIKPMESRRQLRAELEDAIAKVRLQIGVDQTSRAYVGNQIGTQSGQDVAIATLQNTLAELQDALADLGPEDDQGA